FFAVVTVISIAIQTGWDPVAGVMKKLPLLAMSLNARFVFVAGFSLCILAALGAAELLQRRDNRGATITFVVVVGIIAGAALWIEHSVPIEPIGNWGEYRLFAEVTCLSVAALILALRLPARFVASALVALILIQRLPT